MCANSLPFKFYNRHAAVTSVTHVPSGAARDLPGRMEGGGTPRNLDGGTGYSHIPGGGWSSSVGQCMERGGILGPWMEGEGIPWALSGGRRCYVDRGWREGAFPNPSP